MIRQGFRSVFSRYGARLIKYKTKRFWAAALRSPSPASPAECNVYDTRSLKVEESALDRMVLTAYDPFPTDSSPALFDHYCDTA